jgi:hypothetical protein
MASTYSTDLRLELIGSGEQSGVWGSTTNLNLGSLVEQAVAGVESISITSANQALTAFYGAVDQSRNAVLVLSSSAAANVYVPPVSKVYVIKNTGSFAITMYNSTVLGNTTAAGTGLTVASGSTVSMFTDGGSFYAAGLPSGGSTTGTGNLVFSASPTLTGTPLAPTANTGTNTTQIATTAFVNATSIAYAAALGTMSTQSAANVAITGGTITGITDLTVADGGTGASTFTANNVVLGNGTSSLAANMVAPSTSGNVLTSNGTTWTSSALSSLSVFDKSLASNGYQKLPGGLIMQWCVGSASSSETSQTVNFPITFPTAALTVQVTTFAPSQADRTIQVTSFTTSSATVFLNSIGGAGGDITPYIFAIGY